MQLTWNEKTKHIERVSGSKKMWVGVAFLCINT